MIIYEVIPSVTTTRHLHHIPLCVTILKHTTERSNQCVSQDNTSNEPSR
jgi:hypothetical protein